MHRLQNTCIDGRRTRTKQCDKPTPLFGGRGCVGAQSKQFDKCIFLHPCPIDGDVGVWGGWEACSMTCGDGKRQRTRLCNMPQPKYGGKECAKSLIDFGECKVMDCPVTKSVNSEIIWKNRHT